MIQNKSPQLLGNYHTHSNYSGDAKSTLEENILKAIDNGLTQLGITEHGLQHIVNGISKKDFFKQVEELNLLKSKYPQIQLFQSIEADLLDFSGNLDLLPEMMPYLDYIMFGFHITSRPQSFSQFFTFNLPSVFSIFKPSAKKIERNTTAYLRCLEKYPVSFINHINYKMPVNVRPIAKMCKETNTLIELNGKRVLFSPEEIDILLEENVDFIANSDSHNAIDVANIQIPLNIIEKYSIPLERVKNINQFPNLKYLNKGK